MYTSADNFLIGLGAGSRQYCRYTKSALGSTPLKEIWEFHFPGATRFPYYISKELIIAVRGPL